MSYYGILAERRVWTGRPGMELSVAAVGLQDGSVEIETRYVRHDSGRPQVEWRRRLPAATVLWLSDLVQEVLSSAVERIENDGHRSDRDFHVWAEEYHFAPDETWVRVVAVSHWGESVARIEWGFGDEVDPVLELPFVRALELVSALRGAFFVAFEAQPVRSERGATAHNGRHIQEGRGNHA